MYLVHQSASKGQRSSAKAPKFSKRKKLKYSLWLFMSQTFKVTHLQHTPKPPLAVKQHFIHTLVSEQTAIQRVEFKAAAKIEIRTKQQQKTKHQKQLRLLYNYVSCFVATIVASV